MNVIDFYKKITGENKKEKQELKQNNTNKNTNKNIEQNTDNESLKINKANSEPGQLKRPYYQPSNIVGFNHPAKPVVHKNESASTAQQPQLQPQSQTDKIKVEPVKTENIKKQVVGVVNYLKSSTCIVLSENNNRHTLTINNIEQFDFEDSAINEKWHKLLKNHLFNNLKNKNDKIIAYIDNGKVDIFFDYEKKHSLLNEIKLLHNSYKETLAPIKEKELLSKSEENKNIPRAFNPRDMGN